MGILNTAVALLELGAKAAGGDSVSQEVSIGGAKSGFGMRMLQFVLP